jgi:hypothetical protein
MILIMPFLAYCVKWKNKLKIEFPDQFFDVRCIKDEDEFYIVFNQKMMNN